MEEEIDELGVFQIAIGMIVDLLKSLSILNDLNSAKSGATSYIDVSNFGYDIIGTKIMYIAVYQIIERVLVRTK